MSNNRRCSELVLQYTSLSKTVHNVLLYNRGACCILFIILYSILSCYKCSCIYGIFQSHGLHIQCNDIEVSRDVNIRLDHSTLPIIATA